MADKNVAGIAAFKAHCAFVIHGEGRQGQGDENGRDGMGGYGKIASLDDLPGDAALEAKVKDAAKRVAQTGTAQKPKVKKPPRPEIVMPDDFAVALAGKPKAKAVLEAFAPSHRREYLEWVTEAKQPATREKRITLAVDWLAEGKKRNWKYENC